MNLQFHKLKAFVFIIICFAAQENLAFSCGKTPPEEQVANLKKEDRIEKNVERIERKEERVERTVAQPIPDQYKTLFEVQAKLRESFKLKGLAPNVKLVVGIDYTDSNTTAGLVTLGEDYKNLHKIATGYENPYQRALSSIGYTLADFDDDGQIPVFGFGDTTSGGWGIFSLNGSTSAFDPAKFNGSILPCVGMDGVLKAYLKETHLRSFSGPTNWVPIIYQTMKMVNESQGEFHFLLLVGDGKVSNLESTKAMLKLAADFPMAIAYIGVGDGREEDNGSQVNAKPWETMTELDNGAYGKFDNFQFVNYDKVMRENSDSFSTQVNALATAVLQELPTQVEAASKNQLIGKRNIPLPILVADHTKYELK